MTRSEWEALERRLRQKLLKSGTAVTEIPAPKAGQRPLLDESSSCIAVASHPLGYSSIRFRVPVRLRSRVARILTDEAGPAFVIRYYTHPKAYPQDVLWLFPVDHAWPGIDAHKKDLFVAMLIDHAKTPVTWQLANELNAVRRLVRKLERESPGPVHFYEAGPCGYALQTQTLVVP